MNKKNLMLLVIFAGLTSLQIKAQDDATRLAGAKVIAKSQFTNLPNFIKLNPEQQLKNENFIDWATYALNLPQSATLKAYSVEKDQLGFTHIRHKQYVNGFPVEGSMIITHSIDAQVKSVNGDYFQNFSSSLTPTITEAGALQYALKKVNAKKYMWENINFTNQKKQVTNNPNYTFFPKGELVMVHKKNADYSASNMRLAYKFNIYAEIPLYRTNVFVDANSGEILDEQNLICTVDVVGTASTVYSGTVTMTSDNFSAGQYRLQETGRGLGIQTYNLQNGTTYQNVDFTNNSSAWNTTGPDQAATDAHWGAEMTYDYYQQIHSRNSIDGNGFALLSYVHYSTAFANAFWNGQEMTYGDGDGTTFTIMTGLDVCGHEITHGLTNFTAGLAGGEAGALNEGFSDIFGTTIEKFARPLQNDWIMGAEIMPSGAGIRDMSNPKNLGQPNCYLGVNWDPNLEPHQDNGPCIYWYYLLSQGGSGTNDLGNVWNVTGITITKAQLIAFRTLTVYFTPSTNYAAARMYSIQAATDIYGLCSPELASTTNAWYAVGVGAAFSSTNSTPAFTNTGITCSMPMAVTFTNTSANAISYSWSFGDGGTSTASSPTHTYTVAGIDTIKLIATSCTGIKDSITKIITVGAIGSIIPIAEGFEINPLPNPDWNINSPGMNWFITSTAAATGVKSAMLDNFTNTAGNTSILETTSRDISSYITPKLTFKVSYRQQAATNNDKLQVLTSIDCGNNWTARWTRVGSTLPTVTPPSITPLVPTPSQFTTYTVNINGVAGHANVRFRFEFFADTAGPGNNIYLDDINLFDASNGISGFEEQVQLEIYPNPASSNVTLAFNFTEKHEVSIVVTDLLGREIESISAKQYAAGEIKLNIAEKIIYQPGMYIVNMNVDGKIISRKITIQ